MDGTVLDDASAPAAEFEQSTSVWVEHAGFWLRFWATAVDYFLVVAAVAIFTGLLLVIGLIHEPQLPTFNLLPSWMHWLVNLFGLELNLAATPLLWLYFAVFESSPWMATPGKIVCKLAVTDLSGKRIGFLRASNRFFGKILSTVLLGAGFLLAAVTGKKQALHDLLSGCLVIREA
jgi:uncharacterized RDD family membrane protein YckC